MTVTIDPRTLEQLVRIIRRETADRAVERRGFLTCGPYARALVEEACAALVPQRSFDETLAAVCARLAAIAATEEAHIPPASRAQMFWTAEVPAQYDLEWIAEEFPDVPPPSPEPGLQLAGFDAATLAALDADRDDDPDLLWMD